MSVASSPARPRRLVALTTMSVWPPRRGGQARVAGLLGHLGEDWVVEQFAQSIQRTHLPLPPARTRVSPRWTEWHLLDPPSWAWHLVAGRLGYPPVHADRLLALAPRARLRRALARADAVLVFWPWQVGWVRPRLAPGVPLLLDTSDIAATLYPAGPGWWRQRLHRSLAASEARAWEVADVVVAASAADALEIEARSGRAARVLPNGVDTESLRPPTAEERATARRALGLATEARVALFVGSAHPPNLEAVATLERQAAEYARAGIGLVVVGRCGLGRPRVDNVVHAGEVGDLQPYLRAADLAVSPLVSGTGSSVKLLEYLAAGLPTVSTPVGARGLATGDGTGVEACPVEAMPARAAALLADPARVAAMRDAARRQVDPAFSWAAIGAQLAGLLEEAVAASRRGTAPRPPATR